MFLRTVTRDGKPVHHTPAKKVDEAVKRAVARSAPEGFYQFATNVVITSNISMSNISAVDSGPKQYAATAQFTLKRGNTKTDKLRKYNTRYNCTISFKDAVDENNIPDLEVVMVTISPTLPA